MAPVVIEARGLGKRYRLGQQQAAYGSLRESLAGLVPGRRTQAAPVTEMWALRDIDLTVHEGESVGLIGSNGAGKSTLLRILARITEPSAGVVRTRGRVGVLLEVGTGFHPELSGRENVFLSGAVMGMTRTDIRRRFDDIVSFAGVEQFLETPLKRYSSGMQLRLAFAVAAYLEPELMLVDEILAVGDAEFQRRCLERMRTLGEEGRTVVFVSHDLGAVTTLCSRAVWAHHGQIMGDGEARAVVRDYYATVLEKSGEVEFEVTDVAGVDHAAITTLDGRPMSRPVRDAPFALQARVVTREAIPGLDLYMFVTRRDGTVLLNESWRDQEGMPRLAPEPGSHVVRMEVPPVLTPGDYVFSLWLGTEYTDILLREVLTFSVLPLPDDRQEAIARKRSVQPPVRWTSERVGP